MAYSDNFPATRPVFMADFANGGKIDPRATFSRASSAFVADGSKHKSSENLVAYSSDISQSSWTKDGATETGGQTAPDGGTDAYKLTENSSSSNHRIYKLISTDSGAITVSAYLKYIGRQWVRIRLTDSGGTSRYVWFDIQNGVVGTAQTGFSGATITASGNGYYKVSATLATSVASGGTHYLVIGGSGGDNQTSMFVGLDADSFAVWGIQVSSTGETVLNETSGQIHREYAPSLVSKTNNAARFEVGTDGQSEGILIESASTNLFEYDSDLSQAVWVKNDVSVQSNVAISPAGTLTADNLVGADGVSTTKSADNSTVLTTGTVYTLSVYAKSSGAAGIRLTFGSSGPWGGGDQKLATFNLSTGAAITTSGSVTTSSESCGNGWWRLSITAPATTTGATAFPGPGLTNSSGATEFAGDGYSGILLYGFQVEANSFASSLISTSGATATRAADSLSVATADIGYTGGPVSLFCEGTAQGENTGGGQVLFAIHKDDDNRIGVWTRRTNKRIALVSGGGVASSLEESSWYEGKTALSLTTDSLSGSINGRTVLTDTSQPLPDLNGATVYVGNLDSGTAYQMNGHVKRVALYNEALSDTNLQAITS